RLASDIEILVRERFNLLNHIIWAKPSGRWNGCNKESLRSYFPATERIILKLQALFQQIAGDKHARNELERPHHQLVATWQSLNRKYAEL
ncbi:hypothetical protein SBT38_27540, partial [Klebsiella pneumoniae]|nr:hypothetical protein [Klebsiella pneumoniae]